ncbi:hypothetical protein Poly41_48110 [Novipirellula artificiosorum]|uniref:Uncharacterized protein n=1 Tax=Novipirellula artificiosorum TaxID=2528016 RepID=A0A5C6DAA4_9BACT|nr:hypothetical protein Poly41_48110 [Novipirellula artificiosorum]
MYPTGEILEMQGTASVHSNQVVRALVAFNSKGNPWHARLIRNDVGCGRGASKMLNPGAEW